MMRIMSMTQPHETIFEYLWPSRSVLPILLSDTSYSTSVVLHDLRTRGPEVQNAGVKQEEITEANLQACMWAPGNG